MSHLMARLYSKLGKLPRVLGHLRDLNARCGVFGEDAGQEVLVLRRKLDVGRVVVLHIHDLLHHLTIQSARVGRVLRRLMRMS